MKNVCYLFVFVFLFFSCTTNYGEKYGYRRHFFDYKNAIRLEGKDEIPPIEYIVFVGGFDTIALKLKDKEPKEFRVKSLNYKKNDGEFVSFYKIYDEYELPEFSLYISKENLKYAYGNSDEINKVLKIGNNDVLLFRMNESAFLYPSDVEKRKKENDNFKKYNNKLYKENSYFQ